MSESNDKPFAHLNTIEAIRKRPGMYVGSTALFGFIQYLVYGVAMKLDLRPSRVALTLSDGEIRVESDVAIPIVEDSDGSLSPFERFPEEGMNGHGFGGKVLNALSDSLSIEIQHGDQAESFEYRRGVRESRHAFASDLAGPRSILRFRPDASIFTVLDVSPEIIRSYFKRMSFLHPGVRFSVTLRGRTEVFENPAGIRAMFAAITAPYQLLHEPISFSAVDGSLQIEMVYAYQAWVDDGLWCFINNGRAVEGGTHEQGARDALKALHQTFQLPASHRGRNGVVGVMSIHYPEVVWEGCIKARIGNPELRTRVRDLIVKSATAWLATRPDVASQLLQLQTFAFPDAW